MYTQENIYHGKTVLVTGHTGFKGAWLSLILRQLGANVVGYALPPTSAPNLFSLANVAKEVIHIEGDIRDYSHIKNVVDEHQPDILFHLAAQAIVLDGYQSPKETFDINAGGTVNVLEALRQSQTTKACVIITTDKCYENLNWPWGYRENDSLGGKDPYSASKSMAELATNAYRTSFFSSGLSPMLVATARAGNIVGGGDFSDYRIVPDCMRALFEGKKIPIRSPKSARPWLYVLDALTGYLQLGSHLLKGDSSKAEAWNFGPWENKAVTVEDLVQKIISYWGDGDWEDLSGGQKIQEMPFLRLNWDKAANILGWAPQYQWQKALECSLDWYKCYHKGGDLLSLCQEQIQNFIQPKEYRNEIYASSP